MRKLAFVSVLLLVFGGAAFAQGSFNPVAVGFSQIVVGGDKGGTNYDTLVQVLNNNSAATTGHLTINADDGSPLPVLLDGQGPQSAWDITLAPGEARQIQLNSDGGIAVGWALINYSPSDALTTVIIQLRNGASIQSEVGVQPAFSLLQSVDVAVETDDGTGGSNINVGVALANPTTAPINIFVGLYDPANGTIIDSQVIPLAANGHIAKLLSELFPDTPNIGHIRAKMEIDACSDASCAFLGGQLFVATVLRLNGPQFTTIPVAERVDGGDQMRVLPQVAFGGSNAGLHMKTVLYITTNEPNGVFGTVDIFDDNGNPLRASPDGLAPSSSITFTVLGNRVSRVVLSGDDVLRSGWARLTLSGNVHLIADAVFQTFDGQNIVAEASVLESPAQTAALIYANSQPGSSGVGIAFANPQADPVNVHLKVFARDGSVAASGDITLPPNGHLARFLTEIFPKLASVNFDGAVAMLSDKPFSSMALRLNQGKLATLPVAFDGMYRPAVTALRVTKTQRSPLQVTFSIDVADLDPDLATTDSTIVFGVSRLVFNNGTLSYDVTFNGATLIGNNSGTLGATLQPTDVTSVASGTQAYFTIEVYDIQGNVSNLIYTLIRF